MQRRLEPGPAVRPVGARARRLLHRRHGAAALQQQLLRRLATARDAYRAASRARGAACRRTARSSRTETFFDADELDGAPAQTPGFTSGVQRLQAGTAAGLRVGQRRSRRGSSTSRTSATTISDLSPDQGGRRRRRCARRSARCRSCRSTPRWRIAPPISARASPPTSKTQIEVPVTRRYAEMRVEVVGPVFSQVFNPNNAIADRLKHVIEPSFSVQRRTRDRQPGSHPRRRPATTRSSATSRRSATAWPTACWCARARQAEPQAGAPRELLTVALRQSYYTDERASQFDPSYSYGFDSRAPSPFSPISLMARATPTDAGRRSTSGSNTTRLGAAEQPKLLGLGLNGVMRTPDVNVTAGWSRQAFAQTVADRHLDQRQQLHPGARRTSACGKRVRRQRVVQLRHRAVDAGQPALRRLLQRAVLRRLVRVPGSTTTRTTSQFLLPKDRRFNMSFTLAGVGSFSNFFGAFGGGTY